MTTQNPHSPTQKKYVFIFLSIVIFSFIKQSNLSWRSRSNVHRSLKVSCLLENGLHGSMNLVYQGIKWFWNNDDPPPSLIAIIQPINWADWAKEWKTLDHLSLLNLEPHVKISTKIKASSFVYLLIIILYNAFPSVTQAFDKVTGTECIA